MKKIFCLGYPYYKQRESDNFMWWMWHGDVGHWVINKTPGAHGGDRFKTIFGDFECPDKKSWEGQASITVSESPCCDEVRMTKGLTQIFFTKTTETNELYPIYEATPAQGGKIYAWWMWHGPVCTL